MIKTQNVITENTARNALKKHSVRISGHATSITLEKDFWDALKSIAQQKGVSMNRLITDIDSHRNEDENLSSTLRLYILHDLQHKLKSLPR